MVGKVVTLQGQVAVRRHDTQWEPAQVGQSLFAGDSVRTGPASRASILCVDESQIKLNENTVVIIKSISPSPRLQPVPRRGKTSALQPLRSPPGRNLATQ